MEHIIERTYDHDCQLGFTIQTPRVCVHKGDTVQAVKRRPEDTYPRELRVLRNDGSIETITKDAMLGWTVKEYPAST